MPPIPIEARRRHTAANLSALTLANALIFQEELAQNERRVEPIRKLFSKSDFHTALIDHWKHICDTINYIPIFHLAREVLLAIPSGADTSAALRTLANQALEIVSQRAALRHDLMGRVYHYLLLEAKYLGTFYTSVPAATLLLKIALDPKRWNIDWSDLNKVRNFLVADLACGTGTLLMAASQAITDNFVRSSVIAERKLDGAGLKRLHQTIMEDVVHGYDVLPSAVHLTASTLALLAPEIAFRKMQLYSLPMGKLPDGKIYLGSIEYLHQDRVETQLDLMGDGSQGGAAGAVSGKGAKASLAPLPDLDLCVMNPPFVRSVNGNLLFGSLPQWRGEMQAELAKRLRPQGGRDVLASSTVGLGSVFTAIGHTHLKPNGRLALVLPAAITTGGGWKKTRTLIDSYYDLECVVASHDAERWEFSENTDISEVLFVAKKRAGARSASKSKPCLFVNLWKNPVGAADALALGEAIRHAAPIDISSLKSESRGVAPLLIGNEKWGELVSLPLGDLYDRPWLGSAFAQTELNRTNWHLRAGKLVLPNIKKAADVPICELSELGDLGPDGRDIHDGFVHSKAKTIYPAFWNHNASEVTTITQKPNQYLSPRAKAAAGRPARPVNLLWPKASSLMLAVRLRFNTHRMAAVHVGKDALSNVWYPFSLKKPNTSHEKALLLWLNSTLGVLLTAGHRVPTQGAWVQFKKPTWLPMPVLDVTKLSRGQLSSLAKKYDELQESELLPFPMMGIDETRAKIDKAISDVLGLLKLESVRVLLAQEPIIADSRIGEEEVAEEASAEQFELLSSSSE